MRAVPGPDDRPAVDRIDGVPPAIAIDQTNPGAHLAQHGRTMTEINDHLKLLFARAGQLHCRGCASRCGATRAVRGRRADPALRNS